MYSRPYMNEKRYTIQWRREGVRLVAAAPGGSAGKEAADAVFLKPQGYFIYTRI
jgi:hypothetical protein